MSQKLNEFIALRDRIWDLGIEINLLLAERRSHKWAERMDEYADKLAGMKASKKALQALTPGISVSYTYKYVLDNGIQQYGNIYLNLDTCLKARTRNIKKLILVGAMSVNNISAVDIINSDMQVSVAPNKALKIKKP